MRTVTYQTHLGHATADVSLSWERTNRGEVLRATVTRDGFRPWQARTAALWRKDGAEDALLDAIRRKLEGKHVLGFQFDRIEGVRVLAGCV